jgi:hypothetical protein
MSSHFRFIINVTLHLVIIIIHYIYVSISAQSSTKFSLSLSDSNKLCSKSVTSELYEVDRQYNWSLLTTSWNHCITQELNVWFITSWDTPAFSIWKLVFRMKCYNLLKRIYNIRPGLWAQKNHYQAIIKTSVKVA